MDLDKYVKWFLKIWFVAFICFIFYEILPLRGSRNVTCPSKNSKESIDFGIFQCDYVVVTDSVFQIQGIPTQRKPIKEAFGENYQYYADNVYANKFRRIKEDTLFKIIVRWDETGQEITPEGVHERIEYDGRLYPLKQLPDTISVTRLLNDQIAEKIILKKDSLK